MIRTLTRAAGLVLDVAGALLVIRLAVLAGDFCRGFRRGFREEMERRR